MFERVLTAIESLKNPTDCLLEYILVDNNSTNELKEFGCVKRFLALPNARYELEVRQGHAYARMQGIEKAKAPWVVFFDDDNEPESNYLLELWPLTAQYPNVGVWGPGKVEVEFLGEVSPWLLYNKGEFQQKNIGLRQFGCVKDWIACYPPGTGFAVRKLILDSYLNKAKAGIYSDSGRTGKATASAEDVQIIFEGVTLGFAAGVEPKMALRHLIVARKANLNYIKRLRFGMSSSFAKAYCECFPEDANVIKVLRFSELITLVWSAMYVSLYKRKSLKYFNFEMATVAGKAAGRYIKCKIAFPLWLRWWLFTLNLN